MSEFRFGVSLFSVDDEFTAKCRRAEQLGYDVITIPDHLSDALAPFPAMVAAAAATERLHVGTLVLNVPFYNPALLARDIEATMRLLGDRFELGVGSGHMKSEFDDAGLPWRPAAQRVEYLGETLDELRRRLGELPSLLVGGNSDGVLALAARQADTVGFAGLKQAPGKPPGTFVLGSADELEERVAFVRDRAGGREIEFNMLIQKVVPADNPQPAVADWSDKYSDDFLREAPQVLAGTPEQMADELRKHRERYGFTYYTVFEPAMENFAPVIDLLS